MNGEIDLKKTRERMSVEDTIRLAVENTRHIVVRERATEFPSQETHNLYFPHYPPPLKGNTMSWSVSAIGKPKAVAEKMALLSLPYPRARLNHERP